MEYLSEPLKMQIADLVLSERRAFIFLDYDGTLVPIMPVPSLALLGDATRGIIRKLAGHPGYSVGIISGRKLEEIQSLVQIENIIYAGNNGLELKGPDFSYTHVKTRDFQSTFDELRVALEPLTTLFQGSFVEDKGVGLTFHYRLVKNEKMADMKSEFFKWLSPWINAKKIAVLEAKMAYEIRPNLNWTKGSAIRWILLRQESDSFPIYIGDDKTDEYAFRALADRGITIKVGADSKSSARYFLDDPFEVQAFLSFLSSLKMDTGRIRHATQ